MPPSPDSLKSLSRLRLDRSPVAVGFLATPPAGLPHIERALPAGCSYWKEASEGHAFYTTAEDHQNCPVGAFTHGVTLSAEKTAELQSLVGTMIELHYLRQDEAPQIPHRTAPMQVAAYAPLAEAAFDPDLVIFRGNARQIMMLSEAARAAGSFDSAAAMGRPACAMIPHATGTSSSSVASVACIGNRVYTELGDHELYFAVPGKSLTPVLEQLEVMLDANAALEQFHKQRASALSG
jgi:uncharacterized protein (DUF169 family)